MSDISDGVTDTDKAVVLEYLKMTQEFISSCMPEEIGELAQIEDETTPDPSPVSHLDDIEEVKDEEIHSTQESNIQDGPGQIIVKRRRKGGKRHRDNQELVQVTPDNTPESTAFDKIQSNFEKFTIGIGAGEEGFDKIFLSKEK